jgi:hypothetical protein
MLSQLAALLLMFSPEQFCEHFLLDAEYLIKELGRIRQLALSVPLTPDSYGPTNSVVDAVWNLEERIRFLRGLDEAKSNSKQLRAVRRRKREGDDTPEEDSPAVSQPPQPDWNRHQHELFNAEELSGLRSAELSRELREIQKTTPEPSRKEKRRASAINNDRSGTDFSRAGDLSDAPAQ